MQLRFSFNVVKATLKSLSLNLLRLHFKFGSMNCGILNKWYTCCINISEQGFSSTSSSFFFFLHSDTLSPYLSSFVRTMSMVQSRKAALDPLLFYVACITFQLSPEKEILICFSNRILVRLYLVYLMSYVRSHFMHRK